MFLNRLQQTLISRSAGELKLFFSLDTTKMLPNGFDYDSRCVAEPKPTGSGNGGACAAATGEPTTQCCGTFPNRFPFNDKG